MSVTLATAIAAGLATSVGLLTLIWILHRRMRLVRQLSFPLSLAAVAGGLRVFLNLSGESFGQLDSALTWLLLFLVVVLVLKIVGLYFFEVVLRSRDVQLPSLLPKVVFFTAYLMAAVPTLKAAFPGLEMGPLLATSAVTSLVLGLALQPILGNFFAGLVISLERPFRINDWIKFGEIEAKVVSITWRTTRLRTRDNDDLVVPNSRIAQENILNFFYPHPLHMERIYVGAHYRTPPYRVKQAMLEAAEVVDLVLDKPSPAVFLFDFESSAITYELRVWIEDIAEKPAINDELRSAIWESFRRAGITIPFPIRTLEIEPRARRVDVVEMAREDLETAACEPAGSLIVVSGPDQGRKLSLGRESVTIGRGDQCTLVLREPQASGEHFMIEFVEGKGFVIRDLDSQNGTAVGGRKISETRLNDLDRISVGGTVLAFEAHD